MRKLTVLIDMDDTMENLCEVWVNQLSALFNLNVTIDDIHEWDLTKVFPTLNTQEIFWPLRTKALWSQVKPLPGAVKTIEMLKRDGHRVVVVSAAGAEQTPVKLNNCLFKYFPFSMDDVIICSQKDLIYGDVLIDDGPHNLQRFRGLRVLFPAAHNRGFNAKTIGATRVKDWDSVYAYITRVAKTPRFLIRLKTFLQKGRR